MFRSCQARIRGYLAKAEAQLNDTKDLNASQKEQINKIVATFKIKLKQNEFYGFYFDRSIVPAMVRKGMPVSYTHLTLPTTPYV